MAGDLDVKLRIASSGWRNATGRGGVFTRKIGWRDATKFGGLIPRDASP